MGLAPYGRNQHYQDFAISPDGELLAASVKFHEKRNGKILFWNLKTGEQLRNNSCIVQNNPLRQQSFEQPLSDKLRFSPCGQYLLQQSTFFSFGLELLQILCLRTSTCKEIIRQKKMISQAVFSSNPSHIITVSERNQQIAFGNVNTGKEIPGKRITHIKLQEAIILSQSTLYAVKNNNIITIMNYQKKYKQIGKIYLLNLSSKPVIQFSRDDKLLIIVQYQIRLFDVQTRNQSIKLQIVQSFIRTIDTSPDMQYIASYDYKYIEVWNLKNGNLLHKEAINQKLGLVKKLYFSSNQQHIVVGGQKGIWIKNLRNNQKKYIPVETLESTDL